MLSKAKKIFSPSEYKKFYQILKTLEAQGGDIQKIIGVAELLFSIFPEYNVIISAIFLEEHNIDPVIQEKLLNKNQSELVKKYSQASSLHLLQKDHNDNLLHFLFTSFVEDVRVIYFILSHRYYLCKHIQNMPPEMRVALGKELFEVVAPLAHRMGIHFLKEKFESKAFELLFPSDFKYLDEERSEYIESKKGFLEKVSQNIKVFLKSKNIIAEINCRTKNIYSIFKKLQMKGKSTISEIFDVFALRIILDSEDECYRVLGMLHQQYRHIPGRMKDYISLPKANSYQSFHTVLLIPFGDNSVPLEMQIRTTQMNKSAEEGIAAHILYKEDIHTNTIELSKKQVKKKLQNIRSHFSKENFLRSAAQDLFLNRIFTFTPDGEIKSFQQGSTILDFAYSIHSQLGDTCTGAIIGGKKVGIDTPLKNSDWVEILTAKKNAIQVKENWLEKVRTPLAHRCIRATLSKK